MTPGLVYSSGKLRPDVTCAMDRRRAYSPIDRRSSLSILAFRNSAVLKSWLFLANGQLDESRLLCIYRLDAAEAERVHGKILQTRFPTYKTLKSAKLFPSPATWWGTQHRERWTTKNCKARIRRFVEIEGL